MSTPSPPAAAHGTGAKEMAFLKSTLRNKSNWPIILAILASLLIAAVNALVTIKSIYFRHVGTINETVRQLYIAGTTVLATILTKFIGSQFQTLLLRRFDRHLNNAGHQDLRQDSRKWRVILQAAPLKESLWPWARLRIFLSYILIALMTTAMVAFLSPTVSSRTVLTQQSVYNGLSRHMEGNPGICTTVIPLDDARGRIDDAYFWDLGNGSAYYIPANEGGCPTRYAQLLIGNINTFDADSFAYADGGVAVHRSAIGAPINVYSPHPGQAPVLGAVLADYGSSTLSTTQCVPILAHNPISCRTGGTTKLTNNSFTITSDDGLCIFTRTWADRNPRVRSTMVKHMCTHTAPGVGTMVLAASGQYAHFLALTLDDTAGAPPTGPPADQTIYTITCSVDARSKYAHRLVRLDMRSNSGSGSGDGNFSFSSPNLNGSTAMNRISRYSRTLRAVGDCEGPIMDVARIATLGAANWQTLFQNDGSDGWFDLVWEAVGGHQGIMGAYGFADSTTPLADVLGLVAAMVGARFNGTQEYNVSMAVEVEATRVGSGDWVVLLWMAPVLFAAALLTGLLVTDEVQGKEKFSSVELVDLEELFLRSGSRNLKAGA